MVSLQITFLLLRIDYSFCSYLFLSNTSYYLPDLSLIHIFVGSTLDGTLSKKEDVIQETLKQLQLNPEQFKQAIMVGDRCYDILGAQKCGLNSIGVGYGYAQPGELSQAGATYQVEDVYKRQSLM